MLSLGHLCPQMTKFSQAFIAGCVFMGLSSSTKVTHGKVFFGLFCILTNKKEARTGIIFVAKLFLSFAFCVPENTLQSYG